jgi:micrococcal nuclease
MSCIATVGCLDYFIFNEGSITEISDTSVYLFEGTVVRVVDGDTITLQLPNKKTERIRLIGIDTPEMDASKTNPNEFNSLNRAHLATWAQKAKEFTTDKLLHEIVVISYDREAGMRDQYDRILGYVTLDDGTDFNLVLLEKGYARVYTKETFDRKEEYKNVLQRAQKDGTGMWKE